MIVAGSGAIRTRKRVKSALEFSGFGYVSGDVIVGEPYTFKYTKGLGILIEDTLKNTIIAETGGVLNVLSITRDGLMDVNYYITVVPKRAMTTDYLVRTVNTAVASFVGQTWSNAKLTFVDITGGTTSATRVAEKQAEKAEDARTPLSDSTKSLMLYGTLALVGSVAAYAFFSKNSAISLVMPQMPSMPFRKE